MTTAVQEDTKPAKSKSKLVAKSPALTEPGKTKALIYGASGVGKTWFTLTFPTPYYIDTEGGADLRHYQDRLKEAGGAYLGPKEGALDFQFIIDQIQALATEKHEYQTLVIDSITKLYQTCISNEAERLGEKDAFGASKKPAIGAMRRLVNWIGRLDMNVLFVAHENAEWGVVNGQRQEIGKVADVWDKLIYELHLTLRAEKRGMSRVAVVKKSRLTGFVDADQFPLEYAEFATRYGKDFIEAAPKQIVLATAEQVGEIVKLLEVVKVTEAEVEKVLTKAGADSWKELTTEQAAGTIAWLKKKTATNP
jgi:AAA domain-containing protein